MIERVLFVDDDEFALASYDRTLRGRFSVETAVGPERALQMIADAPSPYAVIVSDMRMPGMDGLELLHRVHALSPASVRLILTGNADVRVAIASVNEGRIFRFLEKPCPHDTLAKSLAAALEQHRLERVERELLEKTLHESIRVLTDVLGMVNPEAFSTASRIAIYARHVSAGLGLKERWRFEVAAMLSQLGCAVLPNDTLEAVRLGRRLTHDQQTRFASHPVVAQNLLRHIPRLEAVAGMIGRQSENCGSDAPGLSMLDDETIGARILKACIRFESLVRSGQGHVAAIEELSARRQEYHGGVVAALASLPVETLPVEPHTVAVDDLEMRMVLDEDLRTRDGMLLVAKGVEVTEPLLARIHNFCGRGAVVGSIRVLVPVSPKVWSERSRALCSNDPMSRDRTTASDCVRPISLQHSAETGGLACPQNF